MDNVILNIYDLLPESRSRQSPSSSHPPAAISNLFSAVLAPMGFGAYHTSIDVRGFRYQFGANVGISRTASRGDSADSNRFVPPNGAYRESIVLGQTWCEQGEINAIVQRMKDEGFRGDTYHLVKRNCNHFSETFAMALILGNELLEEVNGDVRTLDKFPAWVNRLARIGSSLGNEDMNAACDVVAEARVAAGARGKVGWDFAPSSSKSNDGAKGSTADRSRSLKKELTDKQKMALAKLKSSK
ncbi:hypothetical protein ACHAW5_008708 [Stephanodiscus triporus]|uniref:PPPDE domain-containing protein n=1 Tax=Stephanodiscus triporus TaxID=2934178 RepID=A0ABD3NN21_9STRA